MKAKQNEIVYMHFTVFDSDGVSPLTGQSGSCTDNLRKDGTETAETVTIAEISSTGRYYASFTPLAVADYDLEVQCPDDRVVGENFEVETNDLDDLSDQITAATGSVVGAVWEELIVAHSGTGTFGEQVGKKLLTFIKFIATKDA